MKAVCIIPARYASTRLPGKPLLDICGQPMIRRVVDQVKKAMLIDRVIVATDDKRIAAVVADFGGEAWMTRDDHPTGTDRLAEVAKALPDSSLILNVQGDEPLIPPQSLDSLIAAFSADDALQMATLVTQLTAEEANNPSVVKVVGTLDHHALYFSRSLIPYARNPGQQSTAYKHIGVYAYRRDFLLRYALLAPTPLEITESLEQLRALEHGYRIRLVETPISSLGVDTPEDLTRVRQIICELQEEHQP
jgi:3-deoxy-manno-octulosonate cytidylyltransferase (CMP-KDO synthetase)